MRIYYILFFYTQNAKELQIHIDNVCGYDIIQNAKGLQI